MSSRPTETRRLVGRYRLDSELGRGAMGTVWSAYDEVLHRPVAVKEVRLSLVPVSERAIVRERTLREARATAMLSHPNVVTLYDVVEVDSEPYVVMELLPSRSLASYIGERGTLSPGETAEIGSAVASALMTAHRAGITHRDVKPGNVLIGTDGQIKLTDFGIARNAAESSMTQTGTVLGSPPYIAPEVAMGRAVGPPADLWGLGATLFACLEGRPPYDAGDPVSTVSAVVHGEIPRPSGHGPVVDVVRGLMVKDPGMRMPLPAVRRRLRPLMADPEGPMLSAPPSPATTEFRLPPTTSRPAADDPHSGLIDVRGRSGTLVEGAGGVEDRPRTSGSPVPGPSPRRPSPTPPAARTAPLVRGPAEDPPSTEESGPEDAAAAAPAAAPDTGSPAGRAPTTGTPTTAGAAAAGAAGPIAGAAAAAGTAAGASAAAGTAAGASAAAAPADSSATDTPGTDTPDGEAAPPTGTAKVADAPGAAADESGVGTPEARTGSAVGTATDDGEALAADHAGTGGPAAAAGAGAGIVEEAAGAGVVSSGEAEGEPSAAPPADDVHTGAPAAGEADGPAESGEAATVAPATGAEETAGSSEDPADEDPADEGRARALPGAAAGTAGGGDPATDDGEGGPEPAGTGDGSTRVDAAGSEDAEPDTAGSEEGAESEESTGTEESSGTGGPSPHAAGPAVASGAAVGAAAAAAGATPGTPERTTSDTADTDDAAADTDDAGAEEAHSEAGGTAAGTPRTSTPSAGTTRTSTPSAGTPRTSTPPSGAPRTSTPPSGAPRTSTPPSGAPRTSTPPSGAPRTTTPSSGTAVPEPSAAETTMVTPRLPESARPAPRPGPTTSGGWSQPYQRPPWAPRGAPPRTGPPQALAADPGPLPFAPTRRPAAAPSRTRRIGIVVLVVVLALAGLVGGYAAVRVIGGQPPFSVSLAPDGPVVDGERMVTHSDDNARYSGTGMGFTALVPSTWQQFRLQQPGGDIVVRYVSDDAERELRIDRLVRFYPAQRAAGYAALLAQPARLGADAVRVEPLTVVAPPRPGAPEPVEQTVYRARSGSTDDRTTWTRLVPAGTDLWVVRMTAPSTAPGGASQQFSVIADSFTPPA